MSSRGSSEIRNSIPLPFSLYIEPEVATSEYGGDLVWLGESLVGFRPYDGCDAHDITNEVTGALAELLREKLGYKESVNE